MYTERLEMWDRKLEQTLEVIQRAMDVASFRRKLIASNVANAETPGYKAVDVDFKRLLDEFSITPKAGVMEAALVRSDPRHFPSHYVPPLIPIKFQLYPTGEVRADGNTVNMEMEMAKMAKNTIFSAALTESLNRIFKILREAITEGGRR
jgi:flagellar basal-body rod protein FlgB